MVFHQGPTWNTPPKIALAFMSSIKALRRAAPWSPMMFFFRMMFGWRRFSYGGFNMVFNMIFNMVFNMGFNMSFICLIFPKWWKGFHMVYRVGFWWEFSPLPGPPRWIFPIMPWKMVVSPNTHVCKMLFNVPKFVKMLTLQRVTGTTEASNPWWHHSSKCQRFKPKLPTKNPIATSLKPWCVFFPVFSNIQTMAEPTGPTCHPLNWMTLSASKGTSVGIFAASASTWSAIQCHDPVLQPHSFTTSHSSILVDV